MKHMKEVVKASGIDQTIFWHLSNKHKNKNRSCDTVRSGEEIITDPNLVLKEAMEYFAELYCEKDPEEVDRSFRDEVESKLPEIKKQSLVR